MARIIRRLRRVNSVDGTLFSFEVVPDSEIWALMTDFGSIAKQNGWEVGRPGELANLEGPDGRLAGVWAPTLDVATISTGLGALHHRLDDA